MTASSSVRVLVLCVGSVALVAADGPDPTRRAQAERRLTAFETELRADPENLRIGAEYRQQAIALKAYDRAIAFLDQLTRRRSAGPHLYLTLALAYVDKVPDSGAIRQALLGRDAMNALTRSIERERGDVPFYIRGVINLYYNRAIFNRTDKGVADLLEARRITIARQSPWVPRIDVSLGDGYWRLDQPDRARATWREGLALCPDCAALIERVRGDDRQVHDIVEHALDPNVRVDTSMRELFPDVLPFSALGIP